jgi:serine/threonine protein kinase
MIQQTIGKYRILEEIASGAFGRVYRGEDTSQHNRPVAIKLMHSAHLRSSQERGSFLQEARLITLLKHPYIVPVLDVGIEVDFPYLIMAYAPNGSLYDHLKQREPHPLPLKVALNILLQIGTALQYAHQQNVIHRDLKPANILFDANGDALLADFSVATMLETSMKYGTAIGTPYYMAPEQFHGTISKEGDQYALGCIAYQMVTGRMPFEAPDFFSLGYKHMADRPVPPTQINLLVPLSVEAAILRAMAKQRTDRFPDVASFLAALGAQRHYAPIKAPFQLVKRQVQRVLPPPSTVWPEFVESAPMPGPMQSSPYSTQPATDDAEEETLKLFTPKVRAKTSHIIYPAQEEMALSAEPVKDSAIPDETGKHFVIEDDPLVQNAPTMLSATNIHWDEPTIIDTPGVPQIFAHSPTERAQQYSVRLLEQALSLLSRIGTASKRYVDKGKQYVDRGKQYVDRGKPGPYRQGLIAVLLVFIARYGGYKRVLSIAAAIALLLVLLGGGILFAISGLDRAATSIFPTVLIANISITPSHVNLDQTYAISAVTGTPGIAQQQVSARTLSYSTALQAHMFPTTGQGTKPATEAQGSITFKSNVYRPMNVSANTKIATHNGLIAYPDTSFILRPHATVTQSAHISTPGPRGNIPEGSINDTCCAGRVTTYNDSAFTGGANVTTYTTVSQSDFNNAVAAVKQMQTAETSSAQANLMRQVHANEQLVGSIQCTPHSSYDHHVGDQASSITGSVSVTCITEVYDQQSAVAMAANLLKAKAISTSNTPLVLTGKITTAIKQAQAKSGGTIALLVEASGTAAYQFDEAQKQALAALIAGKSKQQALSILQKQAGVSGVTISLSNKQANTLPTTTKNITIVVT